MASLREKRPNTELFLVRIFLYSVWIQESVLWTLDLGPLSTGIYRMETQAKLNV